MHCTSANLYETQFVLFHNEIERETERESGRKREAEWDFQENYFKLTRADNDRAWYIDFGIFYFDVKDQHMLLY